MTEELFGRPKALIGMVHVAALPGSPLAALPLSAVINCAVEEARALASAGFDAVMIENMHDRPYLRQTAGDEVVAATAAVLDGVRASVEVPIGVQILAGANRQALAVAAAAGAVFIRAENFVFSQVADEGLMAEADAGPLLRYRRELQAEHIRIFADIKKKHAGHAITADINIAEAARAAAFFGADGVVVTGVATGRPVDIHDLRQVRAAVELPVAVGSGVTPENLGDLWELADLFIIGSYLKRGGIWHQPLDADRIAALMRAVERLRSQHERT